MSKQLLKPNAELDILTADELRQTIEGLVSGYLRPTMAHRDADGIAASGAGNQTITLPPVQRGMEVIYNRIVIDAPNSAFTPGAPFQVANGFLALYRNAELQDFVPIPVVAGGPGIPYVWRFSTSYGIRCRDGEQLQIIIGAPGPAAGTQLLFRAEGYLSPIADDKPGSLLLPGS